MRKKWVKTKIGSKSCAVLGALVMLFTFSFAPMQKLEVNAAKSTQESGVVTNSGEIGNYRISTHKVNGNTTLYVTDKTSGKKKKIAKGELGQNVAVVKQKVYYTMDRSLYVSTVKGTGQKVLDTECKSSNDSAIKILNYESGDLYYSKPKNKKFKTLEVYRYEIASGKKNCCLTDTFSYDNALDLYKNYKYNYCIPSEIGSGYQLSVSTIKEKKAKVLAKNVYGHIFRKNKIIYVTANAKNGKVVYYQAALNGSGKKVLASCNYRSLAKENVKKEESVYFQQMELKQSGACFLLTISTKNGEKQVQYKIDFKNNKVTEEK